ncbi:MAG: prephenate dehydratase [Anaerolineales bacterium]
MRVAFQGEWGAFSEQAICEYFGQVETFPCETFEQVFTAVAARQAEAGLIPIENSLAGSIHQNYDLLLKYHLFIVGEHFLRVRLCLIAFPGVEIDRIRKVISHPQALAQSARYLQRLGIKTEPVYDTAGSVKMLRAMGERSVAAIASRRAAEIYDMQVLAEGIEDEDKNYTRFLVIHPEANRPRGKTKTSIVFTLNHRPGALFKALSVFALRDINLTKIESRPLPGKPWEYLFYVDLVGSIEDEHVERALEHLREYALMLRVFGSYRQAIFE